MNQVRADTFSVDTAEHRTGKNIEQLIVRLWSRRLLFGCVVMLSVAAVVAWAFLATPVYQVSVKLIPRRQQGAGGALQSILNDIPASGALLGLNMGVEVNQQAAIASLKSRALFQGFAAMHKNLLPTLFHKDWNSKTHGWRHGIRKIPTMDDAWIYFKRKIRIVDYNKETGIVTLSIRWTNRWQAAAWANQLANLVNRQLRQQTLNQTKISLQSLQSQLGTTNSLELHNAIYQLMEVQISKEVMAKSRPDYAFNIIDPAVVPDADKFASPRRDLLLAVALPVGVALGIAAVLLMDVWRDFLIMLQNARSSTRKKDETSAKH